MRSFKDTNGAEWELSLNVAAVMRVNDLAGVNLAGDDIVQQTKVLASDAVVLAQVLWAMCKPQAEKRSVSQDSFWSALSADALDSATEGLLDEIVNFTRNPRLRKILLRARKEDETTMNTAMDIMEANLDKAIDKARTEALDIVKGSFGDAQES